MFLASSRLSSTLLLSRNVAQCAVTKCPVISTVCSLANRAKVSSSVTAHRAVTKRCTRVSFRLQAVEVAGVAAAAAAEAVPEVAELLATSRAPPAIIPVLLPCRITTTTANPAPMALPTVTTIQPPIPPIIPATTIPPPVPITNPPIPIAPLSSAALLSVPPALFYLLATTFAIPESDKLALLPAPFPDLSTFPIPRTSSKNYAPFVVTKFPDIIMDYSPVNRAKASSNVPSKIKKSTPASPRDRAISTRHKGKDAPSADSKSASRSA